MLTIKLSQTGKKNKKMFRLIISEKGRDPYGRVLETLGSYNPHTKDLSAKSDRINYWLSKGAQLTLTVNNLLIEKDIITGEKAVTSKAKKPSEKRLNQKTAKEEKKKKLEETEKKEDEIKEVSKEASKEEIIEKQEKKVVEEAIK